MKIQSRLIFLAVALVVFAFSALSTAHGAQTMDFLHRNLLAGRAKLLSEGFVEERLLGTANFSPELRLPIQLEYDSTTTAQGLFGLAWRSPQLESSVTAGNRTVEWLAPWGERIIFPRMDNLREGASVVSAYTPGNDRYCFHQHTVKCH